MNAVEQFNSFPLDRKILIISAAVAILLCVSFGAYLVWFQKPYDVLFSNLRSSDAATMVAELDKKKVPYKLTDKGGTILVPSHEADKLRLELTEGDLPLKGTVGFELFNKSDMGVTEFAQKINYQRALQGELARTIMAMESVDLARVHLALEEPTIFREDRRPPKASVTITTRKDKQLSIGTIRGIQHLIAAAVPDLAVSDVVVLDATGAVVSDAVPVGITADWSDQKHALEQAYADSIKRALFDVYPEKGLSVSVWAQMEGASAPAEIGMPVLNQRDFGIRVSIFAREPLTPTDELAIRNMVSSQIKADPDHGDVLTISAPPAATIQTISANDSFAADAGALATRLQQGFSLKDLRSALIAFGLIALLAAVFVMRSRPPTGLTGNQRRTYARRLKLLLDEAE